MELAAWPVTWALSGGFNERRRREQFAFAVELSRITFPYLLLISLVSLLGGILNSLAQFWVNAAAPILLNLDADRRAAVLPRRRAAADRAQPGDRGHRRRACSSSLWLIWCAAARAGVALRLQRPRLDPDVKQLLTLIWPAAAGAGAVQINLLISTALAAACCRGLGLLHLLCRPAEPAAARPDRHRPRHRPAADDLAPARRAARRPRRWRRRTAGSSWRCS